METYRKKQQSIEAHPRGCEVLRCFEWFEQDDSFLLVLEAAEGGDLRQLLTKHRQEHLEDPLVRPEPGLTEALVQILVEQELSACSMET